jgi:hypothetical protein
MSRTHASLALLATLTLATPLAGQEWQVARQQFAFVGTRLVIQVDVESPGTLRLIRGAPASVRVASRAQAGFTTSGLAEDDRLTLSAAGPGPVDYLVAVPENVWVQVRLPDKDFAESVPRGRSGQWEWRAADRPQASPITEWLPEPEPGPYDAGPLYTTFISDSAPQEVSVPDLSVVNRVSVRLEGDHFRVITGRPLSLEEGSPRSLVIRPANPPMDVVLTVPPGTPSFTLRLGGHAALLLDDSGVTTWCIPLTEQWLSNDRHWFTFNPLDASLQCGDSGVQRHGG